MELRLNVSLSYIYIFLSFLDFFISISFNKKILKVFENRFFRKYSHSVDTIFYDGGFFFNITLVLSKSEVDYQTRTLRIVQSVCGYMHSFGNKYPCR